jgi:dolichol-phosphate mannosyltransferase
MTMVSGQAPETLAQPTRPRPNALSISRIRNADRSAWIQLLKFCIVGASGYVVNLIVYYAMIHWVGAEYLVASLVAFLVAWLNNFVLNRQWTFPKVGVSPVKQAAKYLVVSVIGLVVNLGILWGLVHVGTDTLIAQAIAIAAVTPLTFVLTRSWAFRSA